MPHVTYITPSNETITLNADEKNLMQIAVENGVEGIDGDCGGICSCATCHVQIEPEWIEKTLIPAPNLGFNCWYSPRSYFYLLLIS